MMNHRAILNTHPNVVSVDDTAGAMDENGNIVELDVAAVKAETVRLEAQAVVLASIARLEAAITPRRMREAVLGTDEGWLANQESLIAAERAKL